MKRIISISIIALAALVLASCEKEKTEFAPSPVNVELNSIIKIGEPITITATKGVDTKTVLDGNAVLWSPGDQITILYGNAESYSKGVFTADITEPSATASFTGTLQMVLGKAEALANPGDSDPVNYLYGAFPASDNVKLVDGGILQIPFLFEQTAVEGSFDPKALSSIARSSSGLDLKFFNTNSVLALTVEEDGVTQIKAENIDKSLKGIGTTTHDFSFFADDEIFGCGASEQTHRVTLNPPGETFVKGQTYYMVVCAGSYKGVKFTLKTAADPIEMYLTKLVTAERSAKHPVTLKGGQHLAFERVWGWYSTGEGLWTPNVTAISISHPDGYGMARGLAMDDEYIYLPKSSGYPALAAVSVKDPLKQKSVSTSGMEAGSTFKSSFPRMIKNWNYEVNNGKDVLLVSNLTNTNEANLIIYAYSNGIDAAPVILAQFAWDSANTTEDWRRYGDRFFVTGNWSDGKIYLPSFNANKSVVLSVANGARKAVGQIAAGAANSPDGIKDLTVYPGSNNLFIHNSAVANIVAPTGGLSNGWDEYSLDSSVANGVGTWGYNFFTFCDQKLIAFARINGKKAWIEVVPDKGDIASSLDGQVIFKMPLHSVDDVDAELTTGGLADCAVRMIDGVAYLAGLTRDGGLAVYKMTMEFDQD